MFTKPKNAYSLTHTIIWDILYCYSTRIKTSSTGERLTISFANRSRLARVQPFAPRFQRPLERNYVFQCQSRCCSG